MRTGAQLEVRQADLGKIQSVAPAYPPLTGECARAKIRESILVRPSPHEFRGIAGEGIGIQQSEHGRTAFEEALHQADDPRTVPHPPESGEPLFPVAPRLVRDVPFPGSFERPRFVAK